MYFYTTLVAIALLAGSVQVAIAAAPAKRGVLATADQNAVESLALELLAAPEVKQQKEESRKLFLATPAAATAEGRKTLPLALDELTYMSALHAANNNDPAHPKVTWMVGAPHTWFGHKVPGSGAGFDNPDTVYRSITLDGASRYEITVRTEPPVPRMFSFYLFDSVLGDSSKRSFDTALAGFREREIKTDADGSFTITIDSDPANGRPNHMQSTAEAHSIFIRNMFDDWATQNPQDIVIKRAGGPETAKPGKAELGQLAAKILKGETNTILMMMKGGFARAAQPNSVSKPFTRGDWGYSARGTFKLADDEALLVTVTTPPDQYLGIQVSDLWLHSVEYIHANGSLNNHQAEPSKDGSYTYVISIKDPGVQNWLHTGGLHEGEFFIRWQDLPGEAAASAIREVKLVKLAELPALLPAEASKVTPQQRKELARQRALTYARRL